MLVGRAAAWAWSVEAGLGTVGAPGHPVPGNGLSALARAGLGPWGAEAALVVDLRPGDLEPGEETLVWLLGAAAADELVTREDAWGLRLGGSWAPRLQAADGLWAGPSAALGAELRRVRPWRSSAGIEAVHTESAWPAEAVTASQVQLTLGETLSWNAPLVPGWEAGVGSRVAVDGPESAFDPLTGRPHSETRVTVSRPRTAVEVAVSRTGRWR